MDHDKQTEAMFLSLDGLSVGDCIGDLCFGTPRRLREMSQKMDEGMDVFPPGKWWYTDDTEMALAIAQVLTKNGKIDQDLLAKCFADRFALDPDRGYGGGACRLLERLLKGESWQKAGRSVFADGSMGNGSAMRIAPLGAYFADDLELVREQAMLSALVTHQHPEGVAGAIAVAIAAASAWLSRGTDVAQARAQLFKTVLAYTPESKTRAGIQKAAELSFDENQSDPGPSNSFHAGRVLGNGSLVTCPDTVPFVLWSSAKNLGNYKEAIQATVEAEGDVDTNCAIVGGIVALFAGFESIPKLWYHRRENLMLYV